MGHIPSSKSAIVYKLSAFDVAAACVAPIFALWIRNPGSLSSRAHAVIAAYLLISVCCSLVFFVWFRISPDLTNRFSSHEANEIVKAALFAAASTGALMFTFAHPDQFPRSVPAIHFLTLLAMLFGGRLLHEKLARRREAGAERAVLYDHEKNVIIVGGGSFASLYVGFLDSVPHRGWRIAAVLDDDKSLHGRSILGHTIMGGTEDAEALLDDFAQHGLRIAAFVICDPDRDLASGYRDRLAPLCRSRNLQLELLAERLSVFGPEPAAGTAPARPMVSPKASYFYAKRGFERAVAVVGLLVFLPVLAFTGLLVLASMGAPVIFWQRRVGRHGRTIFVYKFKTMRNAVDERGRVRATDERVTRIGRFLRASRLDELPQLLNVIRGDMAIIGPRPLLPIDQPAEPSLRLAVAPGVTGWAQINGGKLISVEEKNALDEWYVRNASPWVDFQIIWRTFQTVAWGDRRNEDQLAAALAAARKDPKRWVSTKVSGRRDDLPSFVEPGGQSVVR